MFNYLKNNEINNFKNYKRSYRKYWFKFMDFKIKDNIWWDCTFNHMLLVNFFNDYTSTIIYNESTGRYAYVLSQTCAIFLFKSLLNVVANYDVFVSQIYLVLHRNCLSCPFLIRDKILTDSQNIYNDVVVVAMIHNNSVNILSLKNSSNFELFPNLLGLQPM